MLRFIISFLNSRGEFRGDPRGESLGEILGEPPGEPALDLAMTFTSLVNLWSWGISSTSDSSELSVHRPLMAGRQSPGRNRCVCVLTWASVKLGQKKKKKIQTVFNMTVFLCVPLELLPRVPSSCPYV